VYRLSGGERVEPKRACLGASWSAVRAALPTSGALDVSNDEHSVASEAFRAFKGDVENLLAPFRSHLNFDRKTAAYFHSGRSARALVDAIEVAQFGQIHPELVAARKLRQDVFIAAFDLNQLYEVGLRTVKFRPIAKYPSVERDFSFVFRDDVPFIEMKNAVWNLDIKEVRDMRPVEIFRGGSIPAGKYSILLRVRFQSKDRTLREDEIADWSGKIVSVLAGLGGTQRS